MLYKTGRTNANDGGVDFVMRPLGRFFQVTETIDVSKYFLDIDKIQKFPLTFVVKTMEEKEVILTRLSEQAKNKYRVDAIVKAYMDAIEDVINIAALLRHFNTAVASGSLANIMQEIVVQSQLEFNYTDDQSRDAEDGTTS